MAYQLCASSLARLLAEFERKEEESNWRRRDGPVSGRPIQLLVYLEVESHQAFESQRAPYRSKRDTSKHGYARVYFKIALPVLAYYAAAGACNYVFKKAGARPRLCKQGKSR
jgi:hypothetical protein